MALIKCYECGKEISSAAPACLSCGAPNKELENQKNMMALADMMAGRAKCPVCGSGAQKMGSIEGLLTGGIAGVAKKHKCVSCGHLF